MSQTTKQTVLSLFENAILCSGVPSRIRRDKGGENIILWKKMLELLREPNGGNYPAGSSVHNQRIECLWKDVWFSILRVLLHFSKHGRTR